MSDTLKPCPDCARVCTWCSETVGYARKFGCGDFFPAQRNRRQCEKAKALKGTTCLLCRNTGNVRAAAIRGNASAESEGKQAMSDLHYGIIDPDYARVFTMARVLAWSEGYALAMHGSFTRDLDLLAVPWTEQACEPEHLVRRIADAAGLDVLEKPPSKKPHGRLAYTLTFKAFADPRFIDISVMPRAESEDARDAARLRAVIEKFLADNDTEGFGCACTPSHTCGPCSFRKRVQPLQAAIDAARGRQEPK